MGTFGAVGCFSLHPRKTLTTGEGGLLISDSGDLVRRLRRLRSHGMERTSAGMVFHEAGYNYRLTNLQSALGRAQLPHLGDWIAARRELATSYHEALQSFAASGYLIRPASCEGHSWQTYMVVLADWLDRAAVIKALAADGIEGNLGAQCLSELPPFHGLAASEDDMRHARRLYRQGWPCRSANSTVQKKLVASSPHSVAPLNLARGPLDDGLSKEDLSRRRSSACRSIGCNARHGS